MPRYRFVDCDVLISRIARIFKFNSNDWIPDFYEDIYEFIGLVGTNGIYEKVFKTVKVTAYRAELPCDLKFLRAVGHRNFKLDVSSAVAHNHGTINLCDKNMGNYSLDAGHVHTPFECGKITLYYFRVPKNEAGKMMIPDNEKFKIAASYYVMMNILAGGMAHPVFNYEMAEARFREWLPKAQNSISFPSPDEMTEIGKTHGMVLFEDHFNDKMFNRH